MKKPKPILRLYATYYFRFDGDAAPVKARHGACKAEANAVRATVGRIFEREWAKAWIVNRETQVPLHTIDIGPGGALRMRFGGR
jgi:hypothetical protein